MMGEDEDLCGDRATFSLGFCDGGLAAGCTTVMLPKADQPTELDDEELDGDGYAIWHATAFAAAAEQENDQDQ